VEVTVDRNYRLRVRWLLVALLVPGAMAQTSELDRQREYWRQQEEQRQEQQRRAQEEMQRQQKSAEDERRNRQQQYDDDRKRQEDEQWQRDAPKRQAQAEQSAKQTAEMKALRKEFLRLPPLPDERNVLLGSWRLEGGGQQGELLERGLGRGTGGAGAGLGELIELAAKFDPDKALCEVSFGRGITFASSTYSSGGVAGIAGGPIAYRSRKKQVIVAIPDDSRANPMPFEIVGPNRMVWGGTCALVRVGTPAANAAANAPSNARTVAASPSAPPAARAMPQVATVAPAPPPSTLSRPSPEVCRNTLLDKIGTVGVNQVRAMSDVRFKEPAIEGKVPNTNNLRIDLRGSACDDPRIKATLYDFDANEMLQSITYVWDRPPGPTPAPIFQERVTQLSRFHSLSPPQSPGRLQADTTLGRLILQDMPERNLVLEAYAARK
jgi:hypothetical protein